MSGKRKQRTVLILVFFAKKARLMLNVMAMSIILLRMLK